METLGKYMQQLRKKRVFHVARVAHDAGLKSAHIYRKLESGRRVSPQVGEKLATVLCDEDAEREEFARLLEEESRPAPLSPLQAAFNQKSALRVCTQAYAPFSGEQNSFLDHFIRQILQRAGIDFQDINSHAAPENDFDITSRVSWIESRAADILVNLASLQRMKKLVFLLTPIRVSLNAVMLKSYEKDMPAARELLTIKYNRDPVRPFKLLAIENEVGYVYLHQSLKVPDDHMHVLGTLNSAILADALRENSNRRPMLVCDELTALSTVQRLRGEGMLVLQPSTDEAVRQSSKRRMLPAHPLGIGLRRRDNQPLIAYMSEAMALFLNFETESIAVGYEGLYRDLVAYVRSCLSEERWLYMGGVRQVRRDSLPAAFCQTLEEQNARAYAKRCLQISRNTLKDIANDPQLQPWVRVLRRARERVQIAEASDRRRIKAIILDSLKTVIGLDPMKRDLPLSVEQYDHAIDKRWLELKYVLERELDIDLPLHEKPTRDYLIGLDIEQFVAWVQRLMESPGQTSSVTIVVPLEKAEYGAYEQLRRSYEEGGGERRSRTPSRGNDRIFIALNLGEPVGFIETTKDTIEQEGSRSGISSLKVEHVFVVDHMRGLGMTQRMIRSVINQALQDGHGSVWVSIAAVKEHIRRIFALAGFTAGPYEGAFQYTIERLQRETERPRGGQRRTPQK